MKTTTGKGRSKAYVQGQYEQRQCIYRRKKSHRCGVKGLYAQLSDASKSLCMFGVL